MMNPEALLGSLLPRAGSMDQLIQMAAMFGSPPSEGTPAAPNPAPMQTGGLGAMLAPQVQQPQPAMMMPPMPGINMANPGNPSIGAALVGG